jgi:hypothetical protein
MEFKPVGDDWFNIRGKGPEEESFIARRLNGIHTDEMPHSAHPFETGTTRDSLANLARLAMTSGSIEEIAIARQIVDFFEAEATA